MSTMLSRIFLAFVCLTSLVNCASLNFEEELSISDMHLVDGRITMTTKVTGIVHCFVECFSDKQCVTVAYSTKTQSCQMYKYDLTEYSKDTIPQADTIFYKAVCPNFDYTYVRSLGICIKRHEEYLSRVDALGVCQDEEATLMWMDTMGKQSYLHHTLKHLEGNESMYLIGACGISSDVTDWYWDDGVLDKTQVTLENGGTFWGLGEPSDAGCMGISSKTGLLAKIDCTDAYNFICATEHLI